MCLDHNQNSNIETEIYTALFFGFRCALVICQIHTQNYHAVTSNISYISDEQRLRNYHQGHSDIFVSVSAIPELRLTYLD